MGRTRLAWRAFRYLITAGREKRRYNIMWLTDARRDVRPALLVALGASVAGGARDSVLARTLSTRLVACLARGANRVTVTRWNTRANNIKQMRPFSRATAKHERDVTNRSAAFNDPRAELHCTWTTSIVYNGYAWCVLLCNTLVRQVRLFTNLFIPITRMEYARTIWIKCWCGANSPDMAQFIIPFA